MKIVSVANPKGGVAKSTIALHLAYKAAEAGYKTLVVDFDMQGSLSSSLELDQAKTHIQTAAALFSNEKAEPMQSKIENIKILSASSLQGEILNNFACESMNELSHVKTAFNKLKADFDICIIDTAGVLGFKPPMTTAALLVSDFVLIPTTIGEYEAKSLAKSWKYINSIKSSGHNRHLQLLGILPCRINSTSKLEMDGLKGLTEALPNIVLPFYLSERAAVKQAVSNKSPVWKKIRGASHRKAADEWNHATQFVLNKIIKSNQG